MGTKIATSKPCTVAAAGEPSATAAKRHFRMSDSCGLVWRVVDRFPTVARVVLIPDRSSRGASVVKSLTAGPPSCSAGGLCRLTEVTEPTLADKDGRSNWQVTAMRSDKRPDGSSTAQRGLSRQKGKLKSGLSDSQFTLTVKHPRFVNGAIRFDKRMRIADVDLTVA
jgi:hypothetical protein